MPAAEIDALLAGSTFGVLQADKERRLGAVLHRLTAHHRERSPEYANIVDAHFGRSPSSGDLAAVPYIPVGVFKQRDLRSVPDDEVFRVLTSSGTTGAAVSRVAVDRATARRQTLALTAIMTSVLGRDRRPMLIADAATTISNRVDVNARAAGIVGMMAFGRHHTFALDDDMRPDLAAIKGFLDAHAGRPMLLFGFTFMIWQHLVLDLAGHDVDLSAATVVHSGGWKKLEAQQVDNDTFKRRLRDQFGITAVHNFYGMAEQVGSVFLEGGDGRLHPARFADVIVRDPVTWAPQPIGVPGVVQVLSAVPTSYPGHSLLTEDLGVVDAVDSPATPHLGKAFRILGRVPRAELRGCSDTYASTLT